MPGLEESHRIAKRDSFGASVCSMSRRLALRSEAISELPVAFPPGRARLATRPTPTGSAMAPNDRDRARGLLGGKAGGRSHRHDNVHMLTDQVCREFVQALWLPLREFAHHDDV